MAWKNAPRFNRIKSWFAEPSILSTQPSTLSTKRHAQDNRTRLLRRRSEASNEVVQRVKRHSRWCTSRIPPLTNGWPICDLIQRAGGRASFDHGLSCVHAGRSTASSGGTIERRGCHGLTSCPGGESEVALLGTTYGKHHGDDPPRAWTQTQ